MVYSVPFLQQPIQRHYIFRKWVSDHLQGSVFSFLCKIHAIFINIPVINIPGNLNIRIIHIRVPQNEINFQLPYFPNTDRISPAPGIIINDVFQYRSILDSVICVGCNIKTQVGKIIFFFPAKALPAFHVKSGTFAYYFCILQNGKVVVYRLFPYGCLCRIWQIFT